jgi:hypothetical protein
LGKAEPAIELVGVEVEIGNGNLVDEVPLEDGNLLGAEKVTTLLVHDEPPYRLC